MSSARSSSRETRRRTRLAALLLAIAAPVVALLPALTATPSVAAASPARTVAAVAAAPALGSHVLVFDPSMPVADIEARAQAIAAQQTDDEMGTGRWSLLFLPGTYGTDTDPLQITVGYGTEVAGLGASPEDTVINGKVEVYNRCLTDGPTQPYCVALNNFWRSLSNLTIHVNGTGQDGCRASANFWATSQASSLRRVEVTGGNLSLMDYCTDSPQYASGGYLADAKADLVINGSQQQWLTRNSEVGVWTNGVWNQVFAGTVGAPSEATFPTDPYTTLDTTPLSREKPFLYVDDAGSWQVRVPDARSDSRGTDWSDGTLAAGRNIPLSDFYVASPSDSAKTINSQLARGKNLLLTPGFYDVGTTLDIKRDHTVVLGLGMATLTSVGGATPVVVGDHAEDVVLAGITIDAGTTTSAALLRIGSAAVGQDKRADTGVSGSEPSTTLNDVYFRVGGPHVGRTKAAMVVNSDDVLIDHTWVWRADHGVEGFTAGQVGDTDRWATNTAPNGVIVNGDDVIATGLFVEHFQQHNTIWNGEGGIVVLYQNELPYDPPTQADWTRPDGTLGWTGYKVADDVTTHHLYGGGVYVYNRNNHSIVTARGFEVPSTPGVRLHHLLTVNLGAGTVRHVVNDTGAQVDDSAVGVPSYVTDYPG
ncbi:adenylyl cyclase [Nocardioides sp. GY 10127]|uniref:adenylyl cyclase n=1 Tax=Nocardioides sp. GY 10127 TaxID=2569762 RepID=UPI0010A843D7|nr:adenylyl cyclase [Nocardioides sp. GY 10127]TIC78928.1 adenylyl cyclase [Nocardioides sp. GY 10127]